jgi:hypothetical protein
MMTEMRISMKSLGLESSRFSFVVLHVFCVQILVSLCDWLLGQKSGIVSSRLIEDP